MNKYFNPKIYINKLISLFSPIIRLWENKYLNEYGNSPLKHQPVFIIGAPRTGSTILYQIITNQFDVLYIDNLICKFHRNLFFGFWLSNKIFKQKAHNCFRSNHGNTIECGWHAPSECGEFWYRWLPRDRHFIDYDDINDKMVEEIRKEITAVINYFDKPIVFKNLNAGQRMRLLRKVFPDAKFIFVKRDPLFIAQSILKAKRKLGLKDNVFWSIMPKNVEELKQLNGYEQIVKQIFYLEKQIVEDMNLFGNENFYIIEYKDLIEKFEYILIKCREFINARDREFYQKPLIKFSEEITLNSKEIKKLNEEISKLDWDTYNG